MPHRRDKHALRFCGAGLKIEHMESGTGLGWDCAAEAGLGECWAVQSFTGLKAEYQQSGLCSKATPVMPRNITYTAMGTEGCPACLPACPVVSAAVTVEQAKIPAL